MIHENTLRKRYAINRIPDHWDSLQTLDGSQYPGFRTNRIAKVYGGEELYFTIGETAKGKRHGLSATIERIIVDSDLPVIRKPTSDGRQKDTKLYRGFNLTRCSSKELKAIMQRVERAIDDCY